MKHFKWLSGKKSKPVAYRRRRVAMRGARQADNPPPPPRRDVPPLPTGRQRHLNPDHYGPPGPFETFIVEDLDIPVELSEDIVRNLCYAVRRYIAFVKLGEGDQMLTEISLRGALLVVERELDQIE